MVAVYGQGSTASRTWTDNLTFGSVRNAVEPVSFGLKFNPLNEDYYYLFGLVVVPVEGGEDTFRVIGFFGSDYWCRSGKEAAEDIVRQFPKKEVVLV